MNSLHRLFVILAIILFGFYSHAESECVALKSPVKYRMQKGDFIAGVLRKFKLEPIFGKNKSLERTLALNNIKNANSIEPGAELFLPFNCESELNDWTVTDASPEKFRWITAVASTKTEIKQEIAKLESALPVTATIPVETGGNVAAAAETAAVAGTSDKIDARLKEVLGVKPQDPNAPKPEQKDIEAAKAEPAQEVSEALRYRMICEGEWVGDQCINRYSILYASTAGWFNRYDGIDPTVSNNNRGVLLTRLNPEILLGWENYWFPNFKTLLHGSIQYSQLLPEAREVPIDQRKNYLASFQAEARYEKANWGIGLGVAQREKLFYRFRFSGLSQPCLGGGAGFTGCGITANAASVTSYFATVNWIFYQAGKFTNDITAMIAYLGSAGTAGWTIDPGTGWSVEYRIKHDRVKEYIWGAIRYGQQSQNTSIERQDATELGFMFGWAFKLKDW